MPVCGDLESFNEGSYDRSLELCGQLLCQEAQDDFNVVRPKIWDYSSHSGVKTMPLIEADQRIEKPIPFLHISIFQGVKGTDKAAYV